MRTEVRPCHACGSPVVAKINEDGDVLYRMIEVAPMADIDAIEERWAKATPGPWEIERDGDVLNDGAEVTDWPWRVEGVCNFVEEETSEADAEAIAAAPTDVAALLAEIKRLRTRPVVDAERDRAAMAEAMKAAMGNYGRPFGLDYKLGFDDAWWAALRYVHALLDWAPC